MGAKTWEPVGLKWPDIQWKGWCDARRYRCTACGHEQAEWEPFNHKPTCKHVKEKAA